MDKDAAERGLDGFLVRLSKNRSEIALGAQVEIMANLKMSLTDVDEKLSSRYFYGKIVKRLGQKGQRHVVHFTAVPPEVDSYFQALLQYDV